MEDKNAEVLNTNRKISRRDFLKLGGVAAAGAAAGYVASRLGVKIPSPESERTPEIKLNSSTTVLDFFDLDAVKDRYLRDKFPPGFSEEESLQTMGVEDPSTREGLLKAVPQDENQAKLLMLMILKHQYQDHGRNVTDAMDKAEEFFSGGTKAKPSETSIGTAVEIKKVDRDDLNNPVIHFSLNPDSINKLVSDSSESILNMSFQPGNNSFTYEMYGHPDRDWPTKQKGTIIRDSDGNVLSEGKPKYYDHLGNQISEEEYNRLLREAEYAKPILLSPKDRDVDYVDGYFGEHTADNVRMLAQIAQKHPEKIFVAAGGNPTGMREMPDITTIRAELEGKSLWPNNLVVVGYETNIPDAYTGPASYGADIYVSDKDLEKLGFIGASSYATPVVSEIIRQAIEGGLETHKKVKDALLQMTETKKAWHGSEEIEYHLLNLDRARETLSKLRQGEK